MSNKYLYAVLVANGALWIDNQAYQSQYGGVVIEKQNFGAPPYPAVFARKQDAQELALEMNGIFPVEGEPLYKVFRFPAG